MSTETETATDADEQSSYSWKTRAAAYLMGALFILGAVGALNPEFAGKIFGYAAALIVLKIAWDSIRS